jgi:hypothetical protein
MLPQRLEGAMDDDKDKTIVEKISDVVKGVVDTASAAAMKAMVPQHDPEQVAGTTNEQVYIPETDPAPLILSKPVVKKKRKAPVKLAPAKMPPKKAATKKASKKSSKTTAKKPSRKSAKKTKSSAGRKAVGKKKKAKR